MPFTPFHLGVGAVCKAALGDRFSFMVFGGSQVLMDLEPGIKLLTGINPVHGPSHTLMGALTIAVLATAVGKPISEFVLRALRWQRHRISWSACAIAAGVGTISHIGLDAIMHADMRPWYPVAQHNHLLGLISMGMLHLICAGLAVIGSAVVWVRYARSTGAGQRSNTSGG